MDAKPNPLPAVSGKDANEAETDELRLDSAVLNRLIEEVRTQEVSMSRHYNRTYNRHNR